MSNLHRTSLVITFRKQWWLLLLLIHPKAQDRLFCSSNASLHFPKKAKHLCQLWLVASPRACATPLALLLSQKKKKKKIINPVFCPKIPRPAANRTFHFMYTETPLYCGTVLYSRRENTKGKKKIAYDKPQLASTLLEVSVSDFFSLHFDHPRGRDLAADTTNSFPGVVEFVNWWPVEILNLIQKKKKKIRTNETRSERRECACARKSTVAPERDGAKWQRCFIRVCRDEIKKKKMHVTQVSVRKKITSSSRQVAWQSAFCGDGGAIIRGWGEVGDSTPTVAEFWVGSEWERAQSRDFLIR